MPDLSSTINGSVVTGMPDENITLTVVVRGNPHPNITLDMVTWYKVGSPGPIMVSDRVTFGTNGLSVSFMPATTSDSGQYIARIQHPSIEFSIELDLVVKRMIELDLLQVAKQNVTANYSGQVSFVCSATGLPIPTIVWLKDSTLVPVFLPRVIVSTNNGTSNVTSILTITGLLTSDEGQYICKAAQDTTFKEVSYYLSVEVPDPCSSTPCQNNGVCVPESTDYVCKCADGFSGATCNTGKET